MVSKDMYDRIMADRPFKLNEEEVEYRDSTGEEHCKDCLHFYTREVDQHHTCEIFRPKDDESVEPDYVCDFFTTNGDDFPLITSTDKTYSLRDEG